MADMNVRKTLGSSLRGREGDVKCQSHGEGSLLNVQVCKSTSQANVVKCINNGVRTNKNLFTGTCFLFTNKTKEIKNKTK